MPRPDVPAERESGGPARTGRPRRRPRRTGGDPTSQTSSAPRRGRDAGAETNGSARTADQPTSAAVQGADAAPSGRPRRDGRRPAAHRSPTGARPRRNDRRLADDGPTPTFADVTGEVAALAERLPALTLADE